MTWRRTIQLRDDTKRREQHERTRGYDDGFAGRPARSTLAVYQAAWRRGKEARSQDAAS